MAIDALFLIGKFHGRITKFPSEEAMRRYLCRYNASVNWMDEMYAIPTGRDMKQLHGADFIIAFMRHCGGLKDALEERHYDLNLFVPNNRSQFLYTESIDLSDAANLLEKLK